MFEEEHEKLSKEINEYCPGLYDDEENNIYPTELVPFQKYGSRKYNSPCLASVWDSLQMIANDDDSKLLQFL